MKYLKTLSDIFNKNVDTEEVYTTDEKYKQKRKNKGYFTRDNTDTFSFLFLIKSWEEIVGKMLSENSIPLKIKNKTLYVSTKHQIFAQEMSFLDQEILKKIFEKFSELESQIKQIKYINNEFTLKDFNTSKETFQPARQEKKKLHPFSPEYKIRLHKAKELFHDIEDEEVKSLLTEYYLNS